MFHFYKWNETNQMHAHWDFNMSNSLGSVNLLDKHQNSAQMHWYALFHERKINAPYTTEKENNLQLLVLYDEIHIIFET